MIRNLFCILVACVWTTLMFPCTLIAMAVTLNRSASMWVVQRWWSPVLLWAGGATLQVSGHEKLQRGKPYIFISNHQSTIDIPVLFVALPVDLRFVAKKALKYVPILGWYMWLAKFVFIDRGNHREAVRSLDDAAAQIRSGVSIVVFPEGTRSEDRRVLPFKKGPFALAMKSGVEMVPVAIEGSGQLMPKNSWNITPGVIKVQVGAPIPSERFADDRDALIREVRARILEQHVSLGGLGEAKVEALGRDGSPPVSGAP